MWLHIKSGQHKILSCESGLKLAYMFTVLRQNHVTHTQAYECVTHTQTSECVAFIRSGMSVIFVCSNEMIVGHSAETVIDRPRVSIGHKYYLNSAIIFTIIV